VPEKGGNKRLGSVVERRDEGQGRPRTACRRVGAGLFGVIDEIRGDGWSAKRKDKDATQREQDGHTGPRKEREAKAHSDAKRERDKDKTKRRGKARHYDDERDKDAGKGKASARGGASPSPTNGSLKTAAAGNRGYRGQKKRPTGSGRTALFYEKYYITLICMSR